MNVYIALLRGINVSGHHKIKMAELKQILEALGLSRVQTYIQSGNVLFESTESPKELRQRIEDGIRTAFGFSITVIHTKAKQSRVIADVTPRLISACNTQSFTSSQRFSMRGPSWGNRTGRSSSSQDRFA